MMKLISFCRDPTMCCIFIGSSVILDLESTAVKTHLLKTLVTSLSQFLLMLVNQDEICLDNYFIIYVTFFASLFGTRLDNS